MTGKRLAVWSMPVAADLKVVGFANGSCLHTTEEPGCHVGRGGNGSITDRGAPDGLREEGAMLIGVWTPSLQCRFDSFLIGRLPRFWDGRMLEVESSGEPRRTATAWALRQPVSKVIFKRHIFTDVESEAGGGITGL
jgi:hypothetical protein